MALPESFQHAREQPEAGKPASAPLEHLLQWSDPHCPTKWGEGSLQHTLKDPKTADTPCCPLQGKLRAAHP